MDNQYSAVFKLGIIVLIKNDMDLANKNLKNYVLSFP